MTAHTFPPPTPLETTLRTRMLRRLTREIRYASDFSSRDSSRFRRGCLLVLRRVPLRAAKVLGGAVCLLGCPARQADGGFGGGMGRSSGAIFHVYPTWWYMCCIAPFSPTVLSRRGEFPAAPPSETRWPAWPAGSAYFPGVLAIVGRSLSAPFVRRAGRSRSRRPRRARGPTPRKPSPARR